MATLRDIMSANHLERRAREGRAFFPSSGLMTITAGLPVAAMTVQNPAASGRNLFVFRAITTTPESLAFDVIVNPGGVLPTAAQTPGNQLIGGPTSVALVKAGVLAAGAMTGTKVGTLNFGPGRTVADLVPIIVGEATTLGLRFAGALSGAATIAMNLTILFWEEPV